MADSTITREHAPHPRRHCPSCNASSPHLHPAVAFEGEVEVCPDAYHLIPTNQNRAEYIAAVEAKRAALATGGARHG